MGEATVPFLSGGLSPSGVERSRVERDLALYLVTDCRQTKGRPLLQVVESALRGGIRAVQLREKDLSTRELLALAIELRALTARHGARLLVNDRIDVVLAAGADGVHLPANSFTIGEARQLLGDDRLIGVSTHHPAEVEAAGRAGADFAVFGPVFRTPAKERYGAPLGLEALGRATAAARIPVLAIGGIDIETVDRTLASGAAGVAVIRAILAADDPQGVARQILSRLRPPSRP